VLLQAARYGSFLSDPEQFTFATNHGIIQNLGLLVLSLSFPTLPDRERYHDLAIERLGGQLEFLVDESGIARENSAGYQAFDLGLLGMAYRCLTLLGDPIPQAWAREYDSALRALAALRRPDGTLPAIGDTDGASQGDFPPTTVIDAAGTAAPLVPYVDRPPDDAETLAASAGYWIDWDGLEGWRVGRDLGQSVLTWTNPPGPGHKHADELSLEVWADGVAWLTGVGYWPYEDDGRIQAESWRGANAPHLVGEASTSTRSSTLVAHGRTDEMAAIDVQRSGPGTYEVRRQVVRIGADLWVVLDVLDGGDAASESVWTLSPELELQPANGDGSFVLSATTAAEAGRLDFVGSAGTTITSYRGSSEPFAGWHVIGGAPTPAPAVVVEQPAGAAWLATVLTRTESSPDPVSGRHVESRFASADDWSVTLPADGGPIEVRRTGAVITVEGHDASATPQTVRLVRGPDVGPEHVRLTTAFNAMAATYPQFQPLVSRRTNVTIVIVLLVLAEETLLVVVRRRWVRLAVPFRALGTIGWVAVAAWLGVVFLRSWEVLVLRA
jgi:hypothetical protein